MTRNKQFAVLTSIVLAAAFLVGCYETALKLGSPDQSKVDKKFVGDWKITISSGGNTSTADLIVRNIDDKQYYVEWREDDRVDRFSAFAADVKDAHFAHLRKMTDDGEWPEEHTLMRFELKGDQLVLRGLDENFFEGVTTDEQLRQKITENIDNPKMYEETVTGSKKQS